MRYKNIGIAKNSIERDEELKTYIKKHFKLNREEWLELRKECIICGKTTKIHLHHIFGGSPHLNIRLNFIGMCIKHHMQIHKKKSKKEMRERLRKALIEKYGYDVVGELREKRNQKMKSAKRNPEKYIKIDWEYWKSKKIMIGSTFDFLSGFFREK